jgi:SAM-dependent methyltransferase
MRAFVRPRSFDLAINMFTSLGYFDDDHDDVVVLRNLHASLREGGRLVIDMIGKEHLAEIFQPVSVDEAGDGSLLVQRHEIFDDWGRIRNEWILIRDAATTSFHFHHTLYSARELKDRLTAAEFGEVRAYGDLDGNDYGVGSERLVVVARR